MKLSKSSNGWWIVCSFLLSSMASAGEQCNEKARWPEPELCKDSGLARRDRTLNDIYRKTREVVEDKQALLHEQRQWLHAVRDVCPDKACLEKTYEYRIAELSERFIKTVPITDEPLSDADALGACNAIAEAAGKDLLAGLELPGFWFHYLNDTEIPARWALSAEEQRAFEEHYKSPDYMYLLRLAPDQQPERFVRTEEPFSGSSEQVINVKYASNPDGSVDQVPDPEDLIRWGDMGAREYPVIYNKRVFLVDSRMPDPNDLRMLSWVKPSGHRRPLCLFTPQPNQFTVASAKKPELCAQIADGRLPPLVWKDETERLAHGDSEKQYGERADRLGVLELDLDGDGHPERIGRLLYYSTAGTGGESVWLMQLSDDLSSKTKLLLSNERVHEGQGSLDIYSSQGQYYISLSDTVVQLKGDKTEQVCAFNRLIPSEVSSFFKVDP